MGMFFKVINGHLYPEEEEEIHPYCPDWEVPKRLYPIVNKLSRDDLLSLSLLLTNPVATQAQLQFWIRHVEIVMPYPWSNKRLKPTREESAA